jgi:hypothetical protein
MSKIWIDTPLTLAAGEANKKLLENGIEAKVRWSAILWAYILDEGDKETEFQGEGMWVDKPAPVILDEVWMVCLPNNTGVVYEVGSSASEVWAKVIRHQTLGTGVTHLALRKQGYSAKKVTVAI